MGKKGSVFSLPRTWLGSEQPGGNAGGSGEGAAEGSSKWAGVYVWDRTRLSACVHVRARVHENVCVCICIYVSVCVCRCVAVRVSLCGFVSESGDVATGDPLWPLSAQLDWPPCRSASGRCPSALSLSHSGQSFYPESKLSVTPGLCFCRRGVFLIPKYTHNALQGSGERRSGCLEGPDSHWLDCCFLMGL